MKSFGVVAIVLGSVLGSFLWAGQLSPEEKRALEVKPAVVLVSVRLQVRWFPGTDYSVVIPETETGSGFIYRPDGYVITNGHVVADANPNNNEALKALQKRLVDEFITAWKQGSVFIYFEKKVGRPLSDAEKGYLLKEVEQLLPKIDGPPELKVVLQNGQVLNADILQFSPPYNMGGKDVAVLKIPASNLPSVPLGNSDNVRLQDSVMVIGYPGVASAWGNASTSDLIGRESNLEPSATNGHISAIKTENIGTPLLQSDVSITHGNSGGPAFNDKGEVIGLATYGAQEAAGFNFLVPINTAMEFVRQAGAAPEAGTFNKHWTNALDAYDEGKCNRAISEFDNVLQFMPGLRDAQKYRGAAVACVDKMGPFEKLTESTGIYPLIAIPIVVVLIVVLWLALSKSGSAKPQAARVATVATGAAAAGPPALGPATFGRIQFTSGSLSGQTFPVSKEGLWIGRDPGKCRIVLQDDSISGQHAWVVPADGTIVVIDKGSTNGTYVNSVDSPRISKVGLRNGDRVYLGHNGSVFTYFVG